MLAASRKNLLLDRLRRDGRIVAKEMAAEFGLSEDSIRRDLREPDTEGLARPRPASVRSTDATCAAHRFRWRT